MTVAQRLHVVPGQFLVEHLPNATFPEDDEWIALVRAPEGLTVVREASPFSEAHRWIGFYGDAGHGLDQPGVLAAVAGPLAASGIPVFVASTYHADLVLVPAHRLDEAAEALRDVGHRVADRGAAPGASGGR
ncbi:ACT domain-containing protein [Actinomadura rubrisoli]|uniref:ACT domain-containing protein n=1 Tax=Actinomadura rubrisoli TaxID=2530368 RepID=A0A4R5BHV1_9ACTN|nr:ACT domain-containing protein [Actinomadura rubrisoli]TDD86228.1 ACT domain-containing protein [Actinomadura rubrisoli]